MSKVQMRKVGWKKVDLKKVGWRNSDNTLDYPSGAILHFDANEGLFNQIAGKNIFQSSVLPTQYVRKADGSYAASTEVVDVINGEKWLRTCGAVTNLFSGDASIARSVSLTAQAYTLQVFGAGSVSCIYGTAIVGSPLTFTAIVGSVTFTPTGATLWMLTATAYPVHYVPPGVTQPASNATATNGMWFANPDDLELWKALNGDVSGIELLSTASAVVDNFGGSVGAYTAATKTLGNTSIGSNASYPRFQFEMGAKTVGARYKCSVVFSDASKIGTVRLSNSGVTQVLTKSGNTYSGTITADNTTSKVEVQLDGTAISSTQIISATVQRITGRPSTAGIRARLDFSSADLPNSSVLNIATPDDVAGQFLTIQKDGGGALTAKLSDGTNTASVTLAAWDRGAVLHFYPQVKTGATQMRIGYKTDAATSITWGTAATYAGTFGPDATLDRLMIGFNNAYPFGTSKFTVVPGEIADAEILGWWL